jgi:hypothetical protein
MGESAHGARSPQADKVARAKWRTNQRDPALTAADVDDLEDLLATFLVAQLTDSSQQGSDRIFLALNRRRPQNIS